MCWSCVKGITMFALTIAAGGFGILLLTYLISTGFANLCFKMGWSASKNDHQREEQGILIAFVLYLFIGAIAFCCHYNQIH